MSPRRVDLGDELVPEADAPGFVPSECLLDVRFRRADEAALWLARTRHGAGAESRASLPRSITSSARTRSRGTCRDAGRDRARPCRRGGAFVRNHLAGTLAIDFLTVLTATSGVLYVLLVLSLERRRVLHVNVTAHPYAAATAQQ